MRLKDIAVGVFAKLATDNELLQLMEVPSSSLDDIRNQIIEDKYPNDLVKTNLTRLCVYETPTSKSPFSPIEKSFIQIDIYVTKEKNKIDRRVLLLANQLFKLLHKANINGYGLEYYNRLPNLPSDNKEWVKYGVVFSYANIVI